MQDAQRRFERYQMKNLGGFEKLFPLPNVKVPKEPEDADQSDQEEYERQLKKYNSQQKKIALYEEVRSHACNLFENQFGVKKAPPQPQ